ncbi:hydroxymethylbilane synthase [Saprospira sp. CCB-QB6]|uniref:hydroxymethylbilane synthase n=1 Tax=Saprospira sp. CCB-QB6 TaxID=3023936 RepID=UPI00234BA0EF|nr:hydroxymethylbilane synthase [Saprospira sp. CCB-QB6]WCL80111.1 hydroxymethylbilane synthase [Saprospira sp. CCB-QB6]
MRKLIIGTRGSKLALWQAYYTQEQLKALGFESELKIIKTQGDRIQHLSFDKLEGKGFFTKEIESALLEGEIDLAVHSMKDMPTTQPKGLKLSAVSYRDKVADLLLIRKEVLAEKEPLGLPLNAVVGTSSARRKAQILDFRPDLEIKDIRGNVPTRLAKLREGQFDAILLAAAGVNRLEIPLEEFQVFEFDPREFVPAPAQGVLVWQCRLEDLQTQRILAKLHKKEVVACTNVERRLLQLFNGGCQMPLGAYCYKENGSYHAYAAVAESWNSPVKRVQLSASTNAQLAERLFALLQEEV